MKLLNLSLKAIVTLMIAFTIGAALAIGAGQPNLAMGLGISFMALCFIPKGKNLTGVLSLITAADVVTEFGAYYIDEGQGLADLVTKLMQKSVTAGYFPTRITNNTVLRKVSTQFARVLQAFQKAYTPIGGTTFEPMVIPLYKLKIDLQDTPDDLEETWLGFLADSGLDRRAWPYIKWYLVNALMQADKDLELSEIYTGVPAAVVPGTPNAAGTNLYGIKKQINDFNTAGTLNLISVGASPSDAVTYVDYIESMIGETDPLLRAEIDYMFMSVDNVNLYRDGMRTKYNTYYPQVTDGSITTLRNYPIQLIGLPSMVGSNKVWFTPPWNRQAGIKKPGNTQIFQVENVDRTVKAYTDYYKGFGFWIQQYVTSNDVELT